MIGNPISQIRHYLIRKKDVAIRLFTFSCILLFQHQNFHITRNLKSPRAGCDPARFEWPWRRDAASFLSHLPCSPPSHSTRAPNRSLIFDDKYRFIACSLVILYLGISILYSRGHFGAIFVRSYFQHVAVIRHVLAGVVWTGSHNTETVSASSSSMLSEIVSTRSSLEGFNI
jgi:hypothetical protein